MNVANVAMRRWGQSKLCQISGTRCSLPRNLKDCLDDDVALTPIELMEGLNVNHAMGSELEAVEDESAWKP
jgi:hypothetical protein